MRKFALMLMLALVAVALIVSGCGDKKAENRAAASSAAPVEMSAQEIFDKTMQASASVKSMTGTADMTLNVDMGPSASADPSAAMFSQGPIKVSGDVAASQEPMQAEGTVSLSLGGQAMQFGAKLVGDQMWINYMGTWYVAPPDATKELSKQQAQGAATDPLGTLKTMGVDPATWASDMTVVGTEQVAGVETYHVRVTVDSVKMIGDLMKLAQSPDVTSALGDQATQLDQALDPKELEKVEQMFKSATFEFWSQTDTFYPRKMVVSAEIVPPPDEAQGVNKMTISMNMVYDTINEPVTVEPPTDAKPWKELEQALSGLGGLL